MNFLCHLYLSANDPEIQVGNLMGDFVKGPLAGRFPGGIGLGLKLHRWIDGAANGDPDFRTSRTRLDPSFGLYRGVLVDLFYDHFLAAEWQTYHPLPFETFLAQCYETARFHSSVMPDRFRQLLPVIFTELIPSYRDLSGIDRALQRMSARRARPNPLGIGVRELERHYGQLQTDFRLFLPRMAAAVDALLAGWRGGVETLPSF